MCFVVPSGKIHPQKSLFWLHFHIISHPGCDLDNILSLIFVLATATGRGITSKVTLLQSPSYFRWSLGNQKCCFVVSLLLVGDRSTRISQATWRFTRQPTHPPNKKYQQKQSQLESETMEPPKQKKKERGFFKSNQTTQFLSGPRAVFHLEAVDLTNETIGVPHHFQNIILSNRRNSPAFRRSGDQQARDYWFSLFTPAACGNPRLLMGGFWWKKMKGTPRRQRVGK